MSVPKSWPELKLRPFFDRFFSQHASSSPPGGVYTAINQKKLLYLSIKNTSLFRRLNVLLLIKEKKTIERNKRLFKVYQNNDYNLAFDKAPRRHNVTTSFTNKSLSLLRSH